MTECEGEIARPPTNADDADELKTQWQLQRRQICSHLAGDLLDMQGSFRVILSPWDCGLKIAVPYAGSQIPLIPRSSR